MSMRKNRWRAELDAATSNKEVLDLARDYLAFLSRDDFLSLPASCRLAPPLTVEDVAQYALQLLQESLSFRMEALSTRVVQEMSEFFSAASARLSDLRSIPPGAADPSSRGAGA
jgi:hypothetical protein